MTRCMRGPLERVRRGASIVYAMACYFGQAGALELVRVGVQWDVRDADASARAGTTTKEGEGGHRENDSR